ncbi:MAG: hypothetical protein F4Z72_12745 [Gemmatimonadales bacterium]|nr:hypothetical protein [Candidatus Palauibacter irciniicola]MYC18977.1 hypothetical protein [Gemmatimonadales bacterium]
MAAARRRPRLTKARTRRPPFALRALRGLAVLTVAGLVGVAAWTGLRSAGFRFRWDLDPTPPPTADAPALREAPPPSEPSGAADAPEGGEAADVPPPARAPLASGRHERIEFETYADGRPVVANSSVAEEWREQGLLLSFDSYTADATRPHVLDARGYLPPNASMHALSFPLAGDRGLEVGVIHLDFPGRPRRVTFTLFGPDLIEDFEVIVWSGGERLPASARAHAPDLRYAPEDDSGSGTATYSPGGRSLFRAERVRIEAPLGVDRISLDGWGPPGHVLLVDHLEIDP